MSAIRFVVADDHEIVRTGLRTLLQRQPGWEVVAEASDGRETVQKIKELKPDVAVLDIGMPSLNGLEAARQIAKENVKTKVLILTVHESDPLIQDVLNAGARGYLLKSDAGRDLVKAVDAIQRNKTYFSSKIAQVVLEGYLHTNSTPRDDREAAGRLTPRQREVVQLLAEGKSSKEVAVALNLNVKTAETHRANIMRRLDCHCVTELVRYAVRHHIVDA